MSRGTRHAAHDRAARLQALVDHLPALVAFWDADLRNVVANDAYVEWFGRSPAQMEGMHLRDLLGEQLYDLNRPHIEAALRGERQAFDRTIVDTRGRSRHTQVSYVPEVTSGEVEGFYVLVTDVTGKVEAERDLDEAQLVSGVASWSWVPGEEFATWSPQLFRLAGLDPASSQPSVESALSLVHPDDREQLRLSLEEATHAPRDMELRYRLVDAHGQVRHIVSRRMVERDASGAVVRLRGTMLDETEIAEANAELARVNDELVSANRLLSDTVGMIGHDIRQPLAVTLGYLEHLRGHLHDTPTDVLEQQLDRVHGAARRIRRLLDDVLSMATLDSGQLVVSPLPLDLDALLADVAVELDGIDGVGVALAADSTPGLRVVADGFHLRQALVNLGVNAKRYGQPPLEITARQHGGHVEVCVRDRGTGVPADLLPRLFQRFARGDNQSERSSGSTGLGLYLVRRLVEANGGTVRYEHRQGGGASFTVTLPLA